MVQHSFVIFAVLDASPAHRQSIARSVEQTLSQKLIADTTLVSVLQTALLAPFIPIALSSVKVSIPILIFKHVNIGCATNCTSCQSITDCASCEDTSYLEILTDPVTSAVAS